MQSVLLTRRNLLSTAILGAATLVKPSWQLIVWRQDLVSRLHTFTLFSQPDETKDKKLSSKR